MRRSSDGGSIALDLGPDVGAVVVRTAAAAAGDELQIGGVDRFGSAYRTHAIARRRELQERALTAAVFPSVPAGHYAVWRWPEDVVEIEVVGGVVTETML